MCDPIEAEYDPGMRRKFSNTKPMVHDVLTPDERKAIQRAIEREMELQAQERRDFWRNLIGAGLTLLLIVAVIAIGWAAVAARGG